MRIEAFLYNCELYFYLYSPTINQCANKPLRTGRPSETELLDFDVTSKLMFLDLIVKQRQEVLAIDEDSLDDFPVQYYKS